jgi:hypothetical protein
LCKNVIIFEQHGKRKSSKFCWPPNDKIERINSDPPYTLSPTTSSHADPVTKEYRKHLANRIKYQKGNIVLQKTKKHDNTCVGHQTFPIQIWSSKHVRTSQQRSLSNEIGLCKPKAKYVRYFSQPDPAGQEYKKHTMTQIKSPIQRNTTHGGYNHKVTR